MNLSNWKQTFDFHALYKHISALEGLKAQYIMLNDARFHIQ